MPISGSSNGEVDPLNNDMDIPTPPSPPPAKRNANHPVTIGKTLIMDYGARLRELRASHLLNGSVTIRTPELIDQFMERLEDGETVLSITSDPAMPAKSTFYMWCDADPDLKARYIRAQELGQRALADLRLNISMGGEFSSGDPRRDELMIKTINQNIAQRNRAEFGEQSRVEVTHSVAPVVLPTIFLPKAKSEDE